MALAIFIIASLSMFMSSSLAENVCLDGCKCMETTSERIGDHVKVTCVSLGLTGVPKDISKFENFKSPIHLDFSKNMITRVSKADFPPNIPIIALDFSDNRGVVITDQAFSNIKGLVSLVLNNVSLRFSDKLNYLRGMKTLRYLSLNNNYQFGEGLIPVALLSGLDLDFLLDMLFHDCYLKGIENGAFADVILKGRLDLGANQMNHIPDEVRTLKNITLLDMSQNNIKNIPSNSFKGMANLRTLIFSNNYITETSMGRDSFKTLNLKELVMEQTVLAAIPTEGLSSLVNLKVLKLKNNPIKSIHKHSFNGSFCLEYLDITNALVEVDMIHLDGLERCLNTLLLSNMQIREVPSFIKQFRVLDHLSLSGNSISVIKTGDFVGTSISEVSLAENPLVEIQPGAFQPFPHVISLILTDTQISNMSFVQDYAYGTIRDITLGNIVQPCDCDLAFSEYRVKKIHGNCNFNATTSITISTEEFMEATTQCWPAGKTPYKKNVWAETKDNGSHNLVSFTIANVPLVLLSLMLCHSV